MITEFTKWVESRKEGVDAPKNEDFDAQTGGNQGSFGSFDTQQHSDEMGGDYQMQQQHNQQLKQEMDILDQMSQMCQTQEGMSDTLVHTLNQIGGMIGIAKQQLMGS